MSFPFLKWIDSFKGPTFLNQMGYTLSASAPSLVSGQAYLHQSDKFIQSGAGALSQTCVGVKWRCDNPTRPVGDHWLISYYGNPTTQAQPIAGLLARDDGSFELWQREAGHVTMLASTAAGVWNVGTDYTVELRYIGTTTATGGYTFALDGTVLFTASGIITRYSAGITSWLLGPADTGTPYDINDYFWDVVVSSRSSTTPVAMPGVTTFYQLRPTGAGSSTQFTPLAGANWAAVDDPLIDLGATYVRLNISGTARDSYQMADLPGGAPPIAAVAGRVAINAPGTGTWSCATDVYSGGTYTSMETYGVSAPTTPSYSYYAGLALPLSPALVDWTASYLNASEWGIVATLVSGSPVSGAIFTQFYLDVCCAGVPTVVRQTGYALIVG